jgi:hypothetical protein
MCLTIGWRQRLVLMFLTACLGHHGRREGNDGSRRTTLPAISPDAGLPCQQSLFGNDTTEKAKYYMDYQLKAF